MNNTITIQYLTAFAQAITTYLRLNESYRRTRQPDHKNDIRQARNKAYHHTQEANTTLHRHLLQYTEPDYLALQASDLITHWDARDTCYQNLIHRSPDDHPKEAITRLDRAEKKLRDKLREINQIIEKIEQ